jgi:site-specific recombinase XerD
MTTNLDRHIADWLKHLEVRNFSSQSVRTYKERIRFLRDYLTAKHLFEPKRIGRGDLLDFYARLQSKQFSPYTYGTIIRAIKSLFKYLEDEQVIIKSPADCLREPDTRNILPRNILTDDELRRLLEQPDQNHPVGFRDVSLIGLFLDTGIRVNEMVNLTLADVDLKGGVLRVNLGKGRRDRICPLTRKGTFYLRRYIEVVRPMLCKGLREDREPKVMPNLWVNRRGDPLKGYMMNWMLQQYAKQGKIRKQVTPHALRHTLASALVRNGSPLPIVQQLLGHRELKTTSRYVRVAGVEVQKTHEKTHPRERSKEEKRKAIPRIRKIAANSRVVKNRKRIS